MQLLTSEEHLALLAKWHQQYGHEAAFSGGGAASFVTTAYAQVHLIPHDLRALPAELFTKPANMTFFRFFTGSSLLINPNFLLTFCLLCLTKNNNTT